MNYLGDTFVKIKNYNNDRDNGVGDYLTVGKLYEVINTTRFGFVITDDRGSTTYCLFSGCNHLGGGDWELAEE